MSDGCRILAAMSATIWRLVASARSSMPSAARLGIASSLIAGGRASMTKGSSPALTAAALDSGPSAVVPLRWNQRESGAGEDVSPAPEREMERESRPWAALILTDGGGAQEARAEEASAA